MGSGGPRGLQILRSGVSVRGGFDSHAFPPTPSARARRLAVVAALAALTILAASASAGPSAATDTAGTPFVRVRPDSISPVPGHDSTAVIPETALGRDTTAGAVRTLGRSAPREPRAVRPTPTLDQPRWVMLRSLVIPGWGQFHNRAWLKAVLVAAGDGSLRWRVFRDERRLSDLNRDATARQADLSVAASDTAAAGAAYRAALDSGDPQQIAAAQAALLAANLRYAGASDAYNGVAGAYNALLDASTSRRWVMGGVLLYALLDAYVDAHFRTFDVDFQVDPALPGDGKTPRMRFRMRWSF